MSTDPRPTPPTAPTAPTDDEIRTLAAELARPMGLAAPDLVTGLEAAVRQGLQRYAELLALPPEERPAELARRHAADPTQWTIEASDA